MAVRQSDQTARYRVDNRRGNMRNALVAAMFAAYLAAIVAANLITNHFAELGHPEVSIYTAATLVAFDLVVRDVLHSWYVGRTRWAVLGALIVAGSLLSWLVNPAAADIAKWSALAFAAAMTVDTLVYQAARRMPWLERSNVSNLASAATDSAVFCWGLSFPFVVAFGQFTAKVAGGVLFSVLLARLVSRRTVTA